MNNMLKAVLLSATMGVAALVPAYAQKPFVITIGMSGWTGFAPIRLAQEAGIFAKHNLDVDIRIIPQASRNLALASNDIQCAATTIETWITWNANGVAAKQIFQLDTSYGADGLAVRNDIQSVQDLKGKYIAAESPGTSPYFMLGWILQENGMSISDVHVVNLAAGPAAQAFLAGSNDAALTYEPFLTNIRESKENVGKILVTTLDYPAVIDTFGCRPDFIAEHKEQAQAFTDAYFEALEMINTDQEKAYTIMGKASRQNAEEFGKSASYLRWPNKEENLKFFSGGAYEAWSNKANDLLVKMKIIKTKPDVMDLVDTQFID